jgi:hypothetical protein
MKPWYKSKTVWFNILTIGTAVATGLTGVLPLLEVVLTVEQLQVALFITGTVNVALRAVTNSPIEWKK